MLKLYWSANSIAAATGIVLNEGGVHWESVQLDFANAEQTKPEFLAINPKGRVPALATPEGILTETGAILEYLAATAVPGMVPVDPMQAARMRELNYYLASTMHINHAHKMRGPRWASLQSSFDDMRAKVPETMTACCAYLEPQIEGPFFFGPRMTLADAWLFNVTTWLESDGVDVSAFPRLSTFIRRMEARPSVQAVRKLGMLV
jgi:glutathione S-transferase